MFICAMLQCNTFAVINLIFFRSKFPMIAIARG